MRRALSTKYDVLWFIPNKKRPVAYTTKATSDLATLLLEDGATTFKKMKETNNYDSDLDYLCDMMIKNGMGDVELKVNNGNVEYVGLV